MTKTSSAILLTDAAVSRLKKGDIRRRIRDLGSQSLFLIVEPSGRKSWQMRFRRPGGKVGKITLGPVLTGGGELEAVPIVGMPLTLRAARRLAAEVHRQRSLEKDVIAERKAEKHKRRAEIEIRRKENFAATVQRYINEHARKQLRGWRGIAKQLGLLYSQEADEPEVIKGGLAERWADKSLREIDDHDVWTVMEEARRVATPGLGVRNNGHSENRARHLREALSPFFAWAHRNRLVNSNPCGSVAPPTLPKSRDRILSDDEVRWFWNASTGLGPFEGALKVLLLTGQRLDEIAGMMRDELRDDELHIPKERTKNKRPHIVPLLPAALALIRREEANGPFVFTTTGRTPISGWSKTKKRLDVAMLELARREKGKSFELKHWTIHDLRRTFATGLSDLGIGPDVIEQVLNHVSGTRAGVAGIYNRSALLPERREALKRWEQHVLAIVEGRPANVTPIRREG
jgi:integrase